MKLRPQTLRQNAVGKQPERREISASRLISGVLSWPRVMRILTVAILSLSVTLTCSPLVDMIYLRFFFTPETVILPSLVSVGLGLVMYLVGWKALVGTVGEPPPIHNRALWYIVVGLISLIITAALIVNGLISGNQPTM